MTLIAPPVPIAFGFVTGRFALAVADTLGDADELPDFTPAVGTVTFRPTATRIIATAPPTYVIPQSITVTLDATGAVTDANGLGGMWFVVGTYTVSTKFAGVTVPAFTVHVTAEHTVAAPLDLALHAPTPVEPTVKWVVNEQVYLDTLAARDELLALIEAGGGAGGTGEDGASAYEVAVAAGFVGTEAEWLESLVGADGAPGPQGATGPQGEPGTTFIVSDTPPTDTSAIWLDTSGA